MWVTVLLGLAGGLLKAPDEEFQRRLLTIEIEDIRTLHDFGRWCEQRGHLSWAIKCYQRMRDLAPEGEEYREATLSLAKAELDRGHHKNAYALLRDLVTRYDLDEARDLLGRSQNDATRRQRAVLISARTYLAGGDYKAARSEYLMALDIVPPEDSEADFVPRREVLEELAACAARIDEAYYLEQVRPINRSIRKCSRCALSGFELCRACNGKGFTEEIKKYALRGVKKIIHPCDPCGKLGYTFCPTCIGLEFTTDDDKLTDLEREALARVVALVRDHKVWQHSSLAAAIQKIEKALLETEKFSSLDYFRVIQPNYSLSKSLREIVGAVPPDRVRLRSGESVWNQMRDPRFRINFLLGYACEFSKFTQRFGMLRASKNEVRFSPAPSADKPPPVILAPEDLSAFPDENREGWLAVEGVLLGYSLDSEGNDISRIDLEGKHGVVFFTWQPAAKARLEHLENGSWRPRLNGLARSYPFNLQDKLLKAPKNRRVLLMGRFLRDRLMRPCNWFEVWDVRVDPSIEQEENFRRLSVPVEVSLEGLKADELPSLLRWFGLKTKLPHIPEETRLNCSADGCALGVLIDEISRALGLRWFCSETTVIFSSRVPEESEKDCQRIVNQLAGGSRGKVQVTRH